MTNSRDYIEKHVKAIRESKEQKRIRLIDERNARIDALMADWHKAGQDRRDEITTPETTYTFPARTLTF